MSTNTAANDAVTEPRSREWGSAAGGDQTASEAHDWLKDLNDSFNAGLTRRFAMLSTSSDDSVPVVSDVAVDARVTAAEASALKLAEEKATLEDEVEQLKSVIAQMAKIEQLQSLRGRSNGASTVTPAVTRPLRAVSRRNLPPPPSNQQATLRSPKRAQGRAIPTLEKKSNPVARSQIIQPSPSQGVASTPAVGGAGHVVVRPPAGKRRRRRSLPHPKEAEVKAEKKENNVDVVNNVGTLGLHHDAGVLVERERERTRISSTADMDALEMALHIGITTRHAQTALVEAFEGSESDASDDGTGKGTGDGCDGDGDGAAAGDGNDRSGGTVATSHRAHTYQHTTPSPTVAKKADSTHWSDHGSGLDLSQDLKKNSSWLKFQKMSSTVSTGVSKDPAFEADPDDLQADLATAVARSALQLGITPRHAQTADACAGGGATNSSCSPGSNLKARRLWRDAIACITAKARREAETTAGMVRVRAYCLNIQCPSLEATTTP